MQWTSGISTSYPVCAVPSAVDMRASLPLKVEKLINIMAVEQVPFGKGIMIIYTWRTSHHRTEMLSFCLLGKPRKAMWKTLKMTMTITTFENDQQLLQSGGSYYEWHRLEGKHVTAGSQFSFCYSQNACNVHNDT